MIDPVSNKERKKITKMVHQMQVLRKQNYLGMPQSDIIQALMQVLSALAAVNGYVSAYDQGYEGFLKDDGVVSFAWPLDMNAVENGFRWFVPKEWQTVSKKQNIYRWAFREVYQAANELFTKRLPDVDSTTWLKATYVKKGKMNDHEYHSIEADYQGFPLVVVYRKSAKE